MLRDRFPTSRSKQPRKPDTRSSGIPASNAGSLSSAPTPSSEFPVVGNEPGNNTVGQRLTNSDGSRLAFYESQASGQMTTNGDFAAYISTSEQLTHIVKKSAQHCYALRGKVINELYRIEAVIASGGMGQVLLAEHLQRNIPVVIKLMLEEVDRNHPSVMKFLKECTMTAKLHHPNIVKVLDYGILIDGLRPYLVMEWIEGRSLRSLLRGKRRFNEYDVARVISQTCDGLSQVHNKGIIHRDLKPENIMLRIAEWGADSVKILDFGIAQLQKESEITTDKRVFGSLGYMSPERLCAQPIDPRTDIYSLGIIIYESLTGGQPFIGATAKDTIRMHVKSPHTPPSHHVALDNAQLVDHIIDRCIAKRADDRYQTVLELKEDLDTIIRSAPEGL